MTLCDVIITSHKFNLLTENIIALWLSVKLIDTIPKENVNDSKVISVLWLNLTQRQLTTSPFPFIPENLQKEECQFSVLVNEFLLL